MILVFDIGGSQMRIASYDTVSGISEPILIPTPVRYEEAITEIATCMSTLAKGEQIIGIVGGIAGTIDPRTKTLYASPNMRSWIGKHIEEDLIRLTGAKQVMLKNDADMAGLGEAVHGAGKGYTHVAYLTISTGVGGTYVVDGVVQPSRYGFEPGHQIINEQTGETLEQAIGGRSLEARYGKKPKELGTGIYEVVAKRLAVGVHNVCMLWSPDVVVLGGAQMRDISVDAVRTEIEKYNVCFPYIPDIVPAELGTMNGLFGASIVAKQLFT